MKRLAIKYLRQYRKRGTGQLVFVYQVTGNKADIDAYKEAQGENLVEDPEDGILYFTTRFAGKNGHVILSKEGKLSTDMSQFDQANSLIEQFPGALGNAIAQETAKLLMGNKQQAPVETPEPKTQE